MQSSKDVIREKAFIIRNGLSEGQRTENSRIIKDRLQSLIEFKKSETIMCYIDFKSEVMTKEFIIEALMAKKKIVVPVVVKKEDSSLHIEVSAIENIDSGLEKSNFGILEPKKKLIRLIDPKEIDLAVIPGVAFDIQRHRIGYGKGLYDRFLTQLSDNCMKIGICFEAQVQENIPHETHDILMDMIITENRII